MWFWIVFAVVLVLAVASAGTSDAARTLG